MSRSMAVLWGIAVRTSKISERVVSSGDCDAFHIAWTKVRMERCACEGECAKGEVEGEEA